MTNTAWLRSRHRRCISCCILYAFGKPGELKQIVNIPVSQIVEEIVNIPVTDCGRDRRGEQILDCVEEYPEPLL